jgi:AraC-like DNA-binding protein
MKLESGFQLSVNRDGSAGPGLFRLLLVNAGAVRMARPGSQSIHPEGSLILLPPGSRARLLLVPGARIACACFARSLVDPLALNGASDMVVEMLGTTEPAAARLPPDQRSAVCALFDSMEREAAGGAPDRQGMARLLLMEAILLMVRALREPVAGGAAPAGAGPAAPLRFHAAEAMQYIQAHSADQLSLPGLAARYGMNPSYFSRLFGSSAGVTLVEYINRVRIQKSCQLLKRTEAEIMEIALAVGYNNLSHFNRYFRRVTGMSPREYRLTSKR